ncbi:MAG: hypothetical protein M3347_13040 [Armatimonadota bacterium]|nr:hypothetical protein [Armatimonadota bacterium]
MSLDLLKRATRIRNPYVEAIKENYNVIGLTLAAAISAASLNPLPLLVGLVLEAVYLAFVPDSKWYEARLSQRYDAEVEQRRQQLKMQIFPLLRPSMQARFVHLEEVRAEIGTQALDDKTWFREVLRKLDFLLEKFLHFASKEVQFSNYLESVLQDVRGGSRTAPRRGRDEDDDVQEIFVSDGRGRRRNRWNGAPPPPPRAAQAKSSGPARPSLNPSDHWVHQTVQEIQAHYDRELNEIKQLCDQEQDENTKAVLQKRFEVLNRRREFVGKIGRILTNLDHQLELLEDTFGLISDEIRARPPEQVLADIEDVVSQTNTMTQVLEELAPYEQSLTRISSS